MSQENGGDKQPAPASPSLAPKDEEETAGPAPKAMPEPAPKAMAKPVSKAMPKPSAPCSSTDNPQDAPPAPQPPDVLDTADLCWPMKGDVAIPEGLTAEVAFSETFQHLFADQAAQGVGKAAGGYDRSANIKAMIRANGTSPCV